MFWELGLPWFIAQLAGGMTDLAGQMAGHLDHLARVLRRARRLA